MSSGHIKKFLYQNTAKSVDKILNNKIFPQKLTFFRDETICKWSIVGAGAGQQQDDIYFMFVVVFSLQSCFFSAPAPQRLKIQIER